MVTQIIKRDGRTESFDKNKIVQAISKAYKHLELKPDIDSAENIAGMIGLRSKETLTINEVQEQVEEYLMRLDTNIARAYITYRSERDRYRNLVKTYNEIVDIEDNDIKNENANVNGDTPAGQMMKFASTASSAYSEDYLIPKEYVDLKTSNDIYFHDQDYYSTKTTTCLQHDLQKLFKDGFSTEHGFIREPNRLSVATELAAISLQSNQNLQHGGQAIVCWDNALVPYAKKSFKHHFIDTIIDWFNVQGEEIDINDKEARVYQENAIVNRAGEISLSNKKLEKEFRGAYNSAKRKLIRESDQAAEGFVSNMNTMHSRGGGQVVFSSVNTGTDFSPEGRIINKSLLKALYKGLGKGETSIFPIVIWKVKEEVNWSDSDFAKAVKDPLKALNGDIEFETPNFDLTVYAMHVAAKRLFPTFMFLDTPFNQNEKWNINDPNRFYYEGATMGCRTRVFEDRHGEKTAWRRGNLSFTTINLVRSAIVAYNKYPEDMTQRLDYYKQLIKEHAHSAGEQLKARFDWQCTAKAKQFPFMMENGLWEGSDNLKPNDTVKDILKHGTLGIGYIGLAEALTMLMGVHHGESDTAQDFGLEVVGIIKNTATYFADKYDLNYAALATPAEGLSGKFTLKDRKEFGVIEGVTDRNFYTNSNHVPVYYNTTAYEKIQKEAPYHSLTTGGHILYIEMDTDAQKNLGAFMMIIKQMKDSGVGYGAVNVPSCRCLQCGYDNVFEDQCPNCGETELIAVIKRITGYLVGTTNRWNSAKRAEEKARVKHGVIAKF